MSETMKGIKFGMPIYGIVDGELRVKKEPKDYTVHGLVAEQRPFKPYQVSSNLTAPTG